MSTRTAVRKLAKLFGKSDPKSLRELEDAFNDLDAPIVEDVWDEDQTHRNPSEREIPTGPGQSASGDGAFDMTRDYSRPARQGGLSEQYREFSDMLKSLGREVRSIKGGQAALASVFHTLLKGESEEERDEEEEESVKAILLGKARKHIRKARSYLLKAEMHEDGDDDDPHALREEAGEEIKRARKAIERLQEETAGDDGDLDEDDGEIEKTVRALKGLQKRLKGANQADEADDDGNQKGAAEKSLNSGVSVADVLDFIGRRAKGEVSSLRKPPHPSDFAKSGPALVARIQARIDSGDVPSEHEDAALNMLSRLVGLQEGALDERVFAECLAKSHPTVRQLFR